METERVDIRTAENGFIVTSHRTGKDDEDNPTWESEQFVFLDRAKAVQIKSQFFSRIFIFNRGIRPELPFFIIDIDKEWLNHVREREENIG